MLLRSNNAFLIIVFGISVSFASGTVLLAWTGPTQSPTGGNVPAPINVGGTDQIKNAGIGVDILGVFGSAYIEDYLGIGTTNPTQRLHVVGAIRANDGFCINTDCITAWPGTGLWEQSGSDIYYNSGNVGIGTTNPSQSLDVSGNIRSTGQKYINNSSPTVYLQDTNNRSAMMHVNSDRFYILRGCGDNSTSWCSTGSGWPLYIDLNTNQANFGGTVVAPSVRGSNSVCIGSECITSDGGAIMFDNHYSGNNPNFTIFSSGNVAMGNGTAFRWGAGQSAIIGHSENGYLAFLAGSIQRLRIQSNGNVGIGTIPSEKLHVDGNVRASAYLTSSDKRLKENIHPIFDAVTKVRQLSGVSFTWKEGDKQGRSDIGVIAQDMEKIVPEVVYTDDQGIKSVDYARLVPLLIEAIKEQELRIGALEKEVQSHQSDTH